MTRIGVPIPCEGCGLDLAPVQSHATLYYADDKKKPVDLILHFCNIECLERWLDRRKHERINQALNRENTP